MAATGLDETPGGHVAEDAAGEQQPGTELDSPELDSPELDPVDALEAELSQSTADPEPASEPEPRRTPQSSPASPDDPYAWLQQNYDRTPKATQAAHQQSGMEELKTFMDSLDRSASPLTTSDSAK